MKKHIPIASSPSLPCDNDLCGICYKIVYENDKSILCNKCNKWIHIKCNKLTVKQYKYYQVNPEANVEYVIKMLQKTINVTFASSGFISTAINSVIKNIDYSKKIVTPISYALTV